VQSVSLVSRVSSSLPAPLRTYLARQHSGVLLGGVTGGKRGLSNDQNLWTVLGAVT
jgi:hypothetical protein